MEREMARFSSTVAFAVNGTRYKAGTTYADTKANALEGDVIWLGLDETKMSPGFVPLDAAAVTMKGASVFAGLSVARPDGANSIEG
jgi:hypothetical protein